MPTINTARLGGRRALPMPTTGTTAPGLTPEPAPEPSAVPPRMAYRQQRQAEMAGKNKAREARIAGEPAGLRTRPRPRKPELATAPAAPPASPPPPSPLAQGAGEAPFKSLADLYGGFQRAPGGPTQIGNKQGAADFLGDRFLSQPDALWTNPEKPAEVTGFQKEGYAMLPPLLQQAVAGGKLPLAQALARYKQRLLGQLPGQQAPPPAGGG